MPPSIQKIDNQTKTKGNNITLTCPASGDPPLKVFWIKPDGQRTTTNVLTLINITKSEAGEYRCEATNDCGSTLQTINVEVQCEYTCATLKLVNIYLTNRFQVAVRLFSNRSQMTSKCGKNKKVAHEAQPSVSLMFYNIIVI